MQWRTWNRHASNNTKYEIIQYTLLSNDGAYRRVFFHSAFFLLRFSNTKTYKYSGRRHFSVNLKHFQLNTKKATHRVLPSSSSMYILHNTSQKPKKERRKKPTKKTHANIIVIDWLCLYIVYCTIYIKDGIYMNAVSFKGRRRDEDKNTTI